MLKQLKKKVDFLDDLPLVFWQYLSPDFTKNIKLDLIKIYTERAVGKCPRWNFYTPRKLRNSKKKSRNSFVGHPVHCYEASVLQWSLLFCYVAMFLYCFNATYCQAQFQLASSVLVQVSTEISLIISVRPIPPKPTNPTPSTQASIFEPSYCAIWDLSNTKTICFIFLLS